MTLGLLVTTVHCLYTLLARSDSVY